MYVTSLILDNIRIIDHCDLSLEQGVTAFVGDNGQGKTSILEAIYWSSHAKSFRHVSDEDIISKGKDNAHIQIKITDSLRPQDIDSNITRVGRNSIFVNGQRLKRNRDLFGTLRVSIFTPDDLEIIKGSSSFRRGLLDDTLQQISPKYVAAHSDYMRSIKQKNAYLKADSYDSTVLEVLNAAIVASGTQVLLGRFMAISTMRDNIYESYSQISGEKSDVTMQYISSLLVDENVDDIQGLSSDQITDYFYKQLEKNRDMEYRRGHCLIGPHRDDLSLKIDNRDTRTQASQGEQRSMALALKMALHRVVYEKTSDNPVLLLDDVFSELDMGRTHRLIECLPATQTFVTSATQIPTTLKVDTTFHVNNGVITS